jgi:hypothetical protein
MIRFLTTLVQIDLFYNKTCQRIKSNFQNVKSAVEFLSQI